MISLIKTQKNNYVFSYFILILLLFFHTYLAKLLKKYSERKLRMGKRVDGMVRKDGLKIDFPILLTLIVYFNI